MKKLAGLRVTAELKQQDVANAFGITQGAVSLWESGESKPSLDKVPILAKLYGVTEQEIVTACMSFSNISIIQQKEMRKNDETEQSIP